MDQKLRKGQLGSLDVQTTADWMQASQRKMDEIGLLREKQMKKSNEKRWKNLHHYKLLNVVLYCIVHIYPPFTRKLIVSLYFGRCVRTRLGVAISEVSGPPVFHIKAGASC